MSFCGTGGQRAASCCVFRAAPSTPDEDLLQTCTSPRNSAGGKTEVKQSPSQCCCSHPTFSSVHNAAWPRAGPVTAWMGKRWWWVGGAVVQPAIFSTNVLRNHGAESPLGAAAVWGETSQCLLSDWGAEEFGGKPRVIGGCLATPWL